MTEQTGHVCPRCAAHRAPDGTPSCTCTRRASDALRDARTAEAAAAEDFDPLRIRPYVELSRDGVAAGVPGGAPGPEPTGIPAAGATTTGTGGPVAGGGAGPVNGAGTRPGPMNASGPAATAGPAGQPGEPGEPGIVPPPAGAAPSASTMRLAAVPAVPADAALPVDATMRLQALPSEPRAADVRLFQEQASHPGTAAAAGAGRPARRRRNGILAAAGVVVTMVAAAGFAGGLLSYDTPARDGALPEDVRASVPDVSPKAASVAPSASTSPTVSAPAAPASSLSASPSPSASEASTSASPSPSASSSSSSAPPSATATATGSAADTGGQQGLGPAPTLQRGDDGPEVTELQLRMRQLRMYMGDADGHFDRHLEDAVRWYQWARGITSDPSGVYGAATRASLESETSQP
ncbi:peptidoglycan-binding domain-containing protein [Streptomyces sp. SAS_275]|uniref:peptidoglycan-binding domain-containing protein n=1 Tax=Streptomyces sp. SAS_275 TaxID=3412746 RepID=UPI00403CF24B